MTQTVRTTNETVLVFCNPLMKQIQLKAMEIGKTDVPVLILGEKGWVRRLLLESSTNIQDKASPLLESTARTCQLNYVSEN